MGKSKTFYLGDNDWAELQGIAMQHGFVQGTGVYEGRLPNVSALIVAIADGRVICVGPKPEAEQVIEALDQALKFFRKGSTHDVLLLLRAAFAETWAKWLEQHP